MCPLGSGRAHHSSLATSPLGGSRPCGGATTPVGHLQLVLEFHVYGREAGPHYAAHFVSLNTQAVGMLNYDSSATVLAGCVAELLGCTDAAASNFVASANTDDGSCVDVITGCIAAR